jgi:hypothetical protein
MLGPMRRRPLLPAIPICSHCRAHENNSKPKTPKATGTETEKKKKKNGTAEGRGAVSGNDVVELIVVRIVALC